MSTEPFWAGVVDNLIKDRCDPYGCGNDNGIAVHSPKMHYIVVYIYWVRVWWGGWYGSMCIKYVRCGGGIAVSEILVPILVECFVIVAVVSVLNMPLCTTPGAESLVQLDRLL